MSWSELERLVESAEADHALRRALTHCRSEHELVLAARQLGFRITARDLARARCADQQERHGLLGEPPASAQGHCEAAHPPHG
ncbi:protein of unknown function [Cyanobium sp. NIES-981]|nr:protein of unknown function [Cyanobium sp. NIES-981]